MKRRLRLTYTTGILLESIAAGVRYGFDIMDRSGLPDGTVYPALRRLEDAGLLLAEWESSESAEREKRPQRRYYSLTAAGQQLLGEARARFPALQRTIAPPHASTEQAQ